MAQRSRFGWTDGGAQTFDTDLHVQRQTPDLNLPVYPRDSLDGTVYEVVSIGSGQNEITIFVLNERDATGLRDWLSALRRGISMTFTPDQDNDSGTTFTVTGIHPIPAIDQQAEGSQSPRFRCGPIRLRRLDGGAFWPVP